MNLMKKFSLLRISAVFLAVSSVGLSPAWSQDSAELERLFTTYNIAVDVTARSSILARTAAIKQAEILAYEKLFKRLVSEDQRALVPPLAPETLSNYIRGFEVHGESSSKGRYSADIDISFMPQAIMDHWTASGARFALNAGPTLCYVHGHTSGRTALLWEQSNPAQAAFGLIDWQNALRNYSRVEPTLKVRAALDVALVVSDKELAAQQLTASCASGESIVVSTKASAGLNDDDKMLSYRYFVSDTALSGEGALMHEADESETDVIARSLIQILNEVDENWRVLTTVKGSEDNQVKLLIAVEVIADIAEARRALKSLSIVKNITTNALSLPISKISVSYTGTFEQFSLAVQQSGYIVSPWGDDLMLSPINN